MRCIEQRSNLVIKAYQERFGPLQISKNELSDAEWGRFIAALERALARGSPLVDYELEEFDAPRRHSLWSKLKGIVLRAFGPRD